MSTEILKNVEINFPNLFKKVDYVNSEYVKVEKDSPRGKYGAKFLLPKSDVKAKALLDKAIEEALIVSKNKGYKVSLENAASIFLKDGDTDRRESKHESNHGHWVIVTKSPNRPVVVDRDGKSSLTEEDNKINYGAIVNVCFSTFATDSNGGHILAMLNGVQLVKESDNVMQVNPFEVFEPLEEEEEDINI